MLKRQTRQRREYLYRKQQELKEQQIAERKQQLKDALDTGKQLASGIRKDTELATELQYDHEELSIDDEYARAGQVDPKVLVTTARDPSSRLVQFAKEMKLMFPMSQRMNRGNYVLQDIVNACRKSDATDLVILHETRGQPDGLIVSHFPYGPTAYFTLHNVVLRHDIPDRGTVSEQYPHLIFDNFSSKLGNRTRNILKYLFPVPKEDSKRVMTFSNKSDFISFRHHVFNKVGNHVQLVEVGPRFEMRLYEIKLGTVDIAEADTEWVYRPYQRTAKKRDLL